jgi:AraC-like DNA-binding protein
VRQFERSFSSAVGVHPKLYARIVRFEAALDSKARSTKSWTEVAHEFGYYDQTHMVHDFQGFTGDTPTHMLKAVEALFRGQIEAIRSGRRSPVSAAGRSRCTLLINLQSVRVVACAD